MDDATLERLADLVVGFGANVQQDQIVSVTCEPGKEPEVKGESYNVRARSVVVLRREQP